MLIRQRAPTSFDKGVNRFTWLMIRFMAVMVPSVFVINGLTKGDWLEALMFALAVAVGLTTEMLPMIVTVNLAKGALAMSRKRVIVKRLNAIQNFGAMDVLCTDKTGTLTQDKIILMHHFDLHERESSRVLEYAYLNSHFQSGLKNLLDVAVLDHVAMKEHVQLEHRFDKIDELAIRLLPAPHVGGPGDRGKQAHFDLQRGGGGGFCRLHTLRDGWGRGPARREPSRPDAAANRPPQRRWVSGDLRRLQGDAEPRSSYRNEDGSDLTLLGYIALPAQGKRRHRDRSS
jgi:hypothetical protein